MKLTFDPRYNIAYIKFGEGEAQVETLKLSEDLNLDIAPDGKVYGIELLNANEQIGPCLSGKMVVENEETGAKLEVAFP